MCHKSDGELAKQTKHSKQQTMPTLSAVASLSKERTAWNKVMTSTYGVKLKGTNRFQRKTRTKQRRAASRAGSKLAAKGGDSAGRAKVRMTSRFNPGSSVSLLFSFSQTLFSSRPPSQKFCFFFLFSFFNCFIVILLFFFIFPLSSSPKTLAYQMLHDSRLQLLEANNPGDDLGGGGNGEDDDDEYEDDGSEYDDDDDDEPSTGSKRKRKGKASTAAPSRKSKKKRASSSSSSSSSAKNVEKDKRLPRPCTLEQALLDPEAESIFSKVTALPTHCPPRKFCPVTGVLASYRDPATGIPYSTKAAFTMIAERAPNIW